MTIKYSIKCHGCEVLVRQTEDKQYHLVIQAKTNPLSYGNLLKTYKGKHEAIQAAEQFCKMMASAKERGYHLEKKEYFVRPEGKKNSDLRMFKNGSGSFALDGAKQPGLSR